MSRVEQRPTPAPVMVLAGLILLTGSGCSKTRVPILAPNQRPEVRLTSAPVPGDVNSYRYLISWVGNDPDGRVAYFQYVVDPPTNANADTPWVNTTRNEEVFSFRSTTLGSPRDTTLSDFHVFTIRAVDDHGERSAAVARAFFSTTVAPECRIISPRPSHLLERLVPPSLHITWIGTDPDGQGRKLPVKYKFKLLAPGGEFDPNLARVKPDSLRLRYAPEFAGWDSVGGDTTQVFLRGLTPGTSYLFVVVAFDEAGAYSPMFSLDLNMLWMNVTFSNTSGPKLSMWSDLFFYQYPSGGYSFNPAAEVPLQAPASQLLAFNWFAEAAPGGTVVGYRWALDDTARFSPRGDLQRSTIVGPFPAGETHKLYIEAEDTNEQRSLGIIRFTTVAASFDKPLLIVDDTRLAADQVRSGRYSPPTGVWPTAAELDTFLFARGGVPWRWYPAGTLSVPGLFAGYRFDTLGTRTGQLDITIPLSVLGRYRNIIWIVDGKGALNGNGQESPTDPLRPPNALRFMSAPGRQNTLAAWVRQGGRIWLLGGAAGYSSMIPWDLGSNNSIYGTVFGGAGLVQPRAELAPGRFMYDFAHWRSEFIVMRDEFAVARSPHAVSDRPGTPDYQQLPERLDLKDPGTDPLPPYRIASQFYSRQRDIEFLQKPNRIVERFDPGRRRAGPASTLDTLYSVTGTNFPTPDQNPENVAMTYYHGLEGAPVVFSGFDIWSSRRDQCQQLVDFVLQNIWGMSRAPVPATARPASATPPGPAHSAAAGR